MSQSIVTETCCCGAKFTYTGEALYANTQRGKFAAEHRVCREREQPLREDDDGPGLFDTEGEL
jgi:hypothetical protein